MPQVDGDIKLTATLTPGDIKKTAQQLKSELKGLFDTKKGDNLSVQFQKAQAAIVKTLDKIDLLEKKLSALENTEIPTPDYSEVQKMIEDAEKGLQKLSNKMYDFKMEGGDTTSEAYHRMQAEADELNETIAYGKGELQDLVETGKAFTLGSDTEQYKQVATQLNQANNQLTIQKAQLEDIIEKEQQLPVPIEEHEKAVERATPAVRRFGKAHKNSSLHVGNFGKSLKKGLMMILRYGLGIRGLFALFRKLRTAVTEGFASLQQQNDPLKDSISTLKASANALKNSVASAFSPLVEIVVPILTTIVHMTTDAMNRVAQLMGALAGKQTILQAKNSYDDYADSVKASTDALKENDKAQKQSYLSGLDEVKKNDALSASSSGVGATALGFEEVGIDSEVLKFADKLKGKFQEIWEKLQPLRSSFSNIIEMTKQWVEDTDFGPMNTSLAQLGASFIPLLNALGTFFETVWATIILPALQYIVEKIVPPLLNFFTRLNGLITTAIEETTAWLQTLDFTKLQEAFDQFGGEGGAFDTFLKGLTAIGDVILWLYTDIVLPVAGWLIENILPTIVGFFSDLFNGFGNLFTGIRDIIAGFRDGDMEQIKAGIGEFISGLWQILFAPIKMIALQIWEVLKQVWAWIKQGAINVWNRITSWFLQKKAKIDAKIDQWFPGWRQVITAFIQVGIQKVKDLLIKATLWVYDKFKWVKDKVLSVFEAIRDKLAPIMEKIRDVIKTPINAIITFFNGMISGVIGGLNGLIGAINRIHINVPDWAAAISGVQTLGFNIPLLDTPQIPLLAQGAVIPANREFLAIMGDQKNGKNLEAPEELLRQIVREESGNGSNVYNVTATANRKVLFDLVIEEGKSRKQMTGRNPFAFA